MSKKFPKLSQWKQIFKVLKKGERTAFLVFSVLCVASLIYISNFFYIKATEVVPASGGTYTEGVVGQPRFINPIYGETNDVDRSLIDLVFSGLMTYNKEGKIVNDLVLNYDISGDGKTYSFVLKDNIVWQDGKPLTADDVVFTIKTIQNSDYKSPLRANWVDVEIEKTSDKSFAFHLKSSYNSFLENCTVKIIPQHIWENISPENFALSSYNLQPIGSGKFKFESIKQTNTGFIETIGLQANRKYYGQVPFISNLVFHYFQDRNGLARAANAGSLDGFSLDSMDNSQTTAESIIKQKWASSETFSSYSFSLPRYFAAFFNSQKSRMLADANMRQALIYAVNKPELINKISSSTKVQMSTIDSPILSEFFGYQNPTTSYNFDQDKANKLLDTTGFKKNGSGQREKTTTKTPAFKFSTYLKMGSKGTEVTQLQACLGKLGFSEQLQGETNGTFGDGTDKAVTSFQEKYLPEEKVTGEVGKKTRAKLNELCLASSSTSQQLQLTLATINQPQMVEIANSLKNYWQEVGVSIEIKALEISELKALIKERNYDILLYGEALGLEPDLYPFWHSTQVNDPGLNLGEYSNKDVDALLVTARESLDLSKKADSYAKMQDIIVKDAPALFLYNPNYVCWISEKVKGITTTKIVDPAKRFSDIENWYIKTKRIFK